MTDPIQTTGRCPKYPCDELEVCQCRGAGKTRRIPDAPDSTRPEGRSAYSQGLRITANPYRDAVDRWAWAEGWQEAADDDDPDGLRLTGG